MPLQESECIIHGTPISSGIAVGKLFIFANPDCQIEQIAISEKDVEGEIARYRKAVSLASAEIKKIRSNLKKQGVEEGVAILEAHLQLLRDPGLSVDIEGKIRISKRNAEFVFHSFIEQFQSHFLAVEDPYLRERETDIIDIGQRILGHLLNLNRVDLSSLPLHSIVFADELTPSMVAEASPSKVAAFVTTTGSATSHAAIVARAKGIGLISSVSYEEVRPYIGKVIAFDGKQGELVLSPSESLIKDFRKKMRQAQREDTTLQKVNLLVAETRDGERIKLSANIDVDSELDLLYNYGGEGIGLYRSEFAFLHHQELPSEEEQYAAYRKIIEKLNGLPIVIRTFDIGGDKAIESTHFVKEAHPFLGFRAIRFLLKEKDLFRAQLRAILRAAVGADVSILFPMVSSLSELREAKALVEETKKELRRKKVPFGKSIKIGCMIEVPSAAIIADLLAAECDFLSIGTNDLVQYALAVDRSDHSLSDYYTPSHPGVLRLIKMTVAAAESQGVPLSVCGEVAADPKFVPLLLGLGVRELSVATRFLPIIKQEIRSISIKEAKALAKKALACSTAQEIDQLLIARIES